MQKICPACNQVCSDTVAPRCPFCGETFPIRSLPATRKKDPTLAAILSFFVTGLGQAYNGQPGKGILIFLVTLPFAAFMYLLRTRLAGTGTETLQPNGLEIFWIAFVVFCFLYLWFFSIYDAYKTAGRLNTGDLSPEAVMSVREMGLVLLLLLAGAFTGYLICLSGLVYLGLDPFWTCIAWTGLAVMLTRMSGTDIFGLGVMAAASMTGVMLISPGSFSFLSALVFGLVMPFVCRKAYDHFRAGTAHAPVAAIAVTTITGEIVFAAMAILFHSPTLIATNESVDKYIAGIIPFFILAVLLNIAIVSALFPVLEKRFRTPLRVPQPTGD